ncbi:MAG TPA: hypothetical protein VF001_07140 [Candidatus Limnocylindria bacterium]
MNAPDWQPYFLFTGGAAAALIGLIFVAMSLHVSQVMENPDWRGRARGSISVLYFQLLLAIWVLVPGQSDVILGAEIAFVGLFAVIVTGPRLWRIFEHAHFERTVMLTYGLAMASYAAMVVAGLAILARQATLAGGMLTLSTVTGFTFAIVSAWWFLARIGETA